MRVLKSRYITEAVLQPSNSARSCHDCSKNQEGLCIGFSRLVNTILDKGIDCSSWERRRPDAY